MSHFIVSQYTITDPDRFAAYAAKAGPTLAAYGRSIAAAGEVLNVLEGELQFQRQIVLAFPDAESANGWYNSPEYQAIIEERRASTQGTAFVVG